MKTFVITILLLLSGPAAYAQDDKLSAEQVERLKAVKADFATRAATPALDLAATATRIYENMLSDQEDQKLRRRLESDLHKHGRTIINLKGESFRAMLAVLTTAQKQLVRKEMLLASGPADLGEIIEKTFGLKEK